MKLCLTSFLLISFRLLSSFFSPFFLVPQPGGPVFQGGGADLGILKSLSSMSVLARRNLNNLALQFSKHSQGEGGSAEERDRLVQDEGVCNHITSHHNIVYHITYHHVENRLFEMFIEVFYLPSFSSPSLSSPLHIA